MSGHSLDIDLSELLYLEQRRLHDAHSLTIDRFDGYLSLHRPLGEPGTPRFDLRPALRRQPVDSLDCAQRRIDIEDDGIEAAQRMLPGARIPSGSSSLFTAVIIEI